MKTKIQTDKRLVTQIITDIGPLDYGDVVSLLTEKQVPFDGIFIECNTKRAYVWIKKIKPIIPINPPLEAIKA